MDVCQYRSDTLQALLEARKQCQNGLQSYSEAFSLSSEASKRLVGDISEFLNSDCDELPNSMRQLAKLASSDVSCQIRSRL